MKVQLLEIKRREAYETDANRIVGKIGLTSENGDQTIVLSAKVISAIFKLLTKEMGQKAKLNAKKVEQAVEEASEEQLLLDNDGKLLIEVNNE